MAHSTSTKVTGLRDLPPLSNVALEVVRRTTQEDLAPEHLARLIAKDPSLAVKILRVANSSFYGLRTQVKTLQQAIVVLGQLSVVSICSAISTLGVLTPRQPAAHPRYSNVILRRHATLTAIVARYAAQHSEAPRLSAADAYMAGLLHDIGELALAVFYAPQLDALRQFEVECPDGPSLEAERQILGVDHECVGSEVLERWHLPPLFIRVARHHHDPAGVPDAPDRAMVELIRTADAVADLLMSALDPPEVDSAGAPMVGADHKLAEVARVAPSLSARLHQHLDAVLAETRMMEQCV